MTATGLFILGSDSAGFEFLALTLALTLREKEVLLRLARGDTSRRISEKLFISHNTVRSHVQSIITKLGVENRTRAARRAIELGIVPDDPRADPFSA